MSSTEKKKTVQTVLFGKPKVYKIFCNPTSYYEKIVNKIWQDNSVREGLTKAEACTRGQDMYKNFQGNTKEMDRFLNTVSNEPAIIPECKFLQPKPKAPETMASSDDGDKFKTPSASSGKQDGHFIQPSDLLGKGQKTNLKVHIQKDSMVTFVKFLGVDPEKLLTDDVCGVQAFSDSLSRLNSLTNVYWYQKEDYEKLSTKVRVKSEIKDGITNVETKLKTVGQKLKEIAECNVNMNSKELLLRAVRTKCRLLQDAIALIGQCEVVMQDTTKRLRVRISQIRAKLDPMPRSNDFRIKCQNTSSLVWETAISNVLTSDDVIAGNGVLSDQAILRVCDILRDTTAITAREVLEMVCDTEPDNYAFQLEATGMFLAYMPIMAIYRGFQIVLVNLHEVGSNLDELLHLDLDLDTEKEVTSTSDNSENTYTEATHKDQEQAKSRAGGRIPIHEKHPEIIATMTRFLQEHSFRAQERRRSDTATSTGVSLKQIRDHIRRTHLDVNISESTIHRLTVAPHKGHKNAKLFKGLVNARVPAKRNNAENDQHKDLHYTRAQVAYCNELFELYSEECLRISADDKNKIHTGIPAVSRQYKIRKYFVQEDAPDYDEHDFPLAKSKIIPSGYLVMKSKRMPSLSPPRTSAKKNPRSKSAPPAPGKPDKSVTNKSTMYDKFGRPHVLYPRTGVLNLYNRAQRFCSSSAANHATDLREIINNECIAKHSILITTDNGPDYNPKSLLTFYFLGCLWRDLKLHCLIQTTFAAGHSSHNMIEHSWSPITNFLVGVILPNKLQEEHKAPDEQSGLSNEAKNDKNAQVYDNAISILNSHLKDKRYDGFPIQSKGVSCIPEQNPFYEETPSITKLSSAGVRELRDKAEYRVLRKELSFLYKHSVVRHNQIEFVVCSNQCEHCQAIPGKDDSKLLQFLQSNDNRMPTPTRSSVHVGHYQTLLEYMSQRERGQSVTPIDAGLPSLEGKEPQMCPRGCKVVLTSEAAKKRHENLVHMRERENDMHTRKRKASAMDESRPPPVHTCSFMLTSGEKCGQEFQTYYQLKKHKDTNNHKKQRGQ